MRAPVFFDEPVLVMGDPGGLRKICSPEIGFVFVYRLGESNIKARVNAAVFWHIIGGCGEP